MPARPSKDKMQCPHCLCGQSKVENTDVHTVKWYGRVRTIIKRYRKCRNCGLSFTTIETYEDENKPNQPEPVIPPTAIDQKKEDIATSAFKAGYDSAVQEILASQPNKSPKRHRG